ncbi:hypothetical protein [Hymenobacter cellulosilyticus]|uniref:OmpH family outer membrane protein n=1 Tax=Hymenobacter cellulosilyticus TaxID=2932248 RepID=A0A8T9QDZ3_9BACT|nr:hypothetical protein [Hymenobacter cellulosilyticus]UOQ74631.1 hypothetical protein MUN79_12620 [Hymenobacter cellulosilyticus]
MKATLLNFLSLLLLVLLTGATAQAQGSRPDKPGRQEIQAYYQANVLPVVRQQRQKLETQLAADDKAQLATYRKELHDLRQRRQGLVQSLKAAGTPKAPCSDPCPEAAVAGATLS